MDIHAIGLDLGKTVLIKGRFKSVGGIANGWSAARKLATNTFARAREMDNDNTT